MLLSLWVHNMARSTHTTYSCGRRQNPERQCCPTGFVKIGTLEWEEVREENPQRGEPL